MLFSEPNIASLVNASFEPVWQAVRPVPIVRIDFGNGNVITRTLHGNIATYVCTADGSVLDILPGIYDREAYQDRLTQFQMLHRWVRQDPDRRAVVLASYHNRQAEALAKNEPPPRIAIKADRTKRKIERRMEFILRSGAEGDAADTAKTASENSPNTLKAAGDLASWKALAEDTRINESSRRMMIHRYLNDKTNIRPDDITKWLYREVLHADLDDPYLGLGKVLFANYPFRAEDES